MKINRIIGLYGSVILFPLFSISVYSQANTSPVSKPAATSDTVATKYAALAVDRGNGFYFAWTADYSTLAEAEKKAIEACNKKGGRCTIILSFSGTGCAAYRFITGNVGMGYGWGLAKTKEEADEIAKKECAERSYGLPAPNLIFICNSPGSGDLKEIYNAHDEIKSLTPGTVTDY